MAVIKTYDGLISRIANGFSLNQPLWGEVQTAAGTLGQNNWQFVMGARTKTLPSFPSGVTGYIPTVVSLANSGGTAGSVMVAYMINLGTLVLGSTLTDGSVMPTMTELGTSRQIPGPIWMEITTALSAATATITVTYQDQDGNSSETTTGQQISASAPIGTAGWIELNSTDTGVIDISAATRSSGTGTGTVKFWGIIPISMFAFPNITSSIAYDNLLTGGFNLIRLPASVEVGFFVQKTTTHSNIGNLFVVGDS